jgi:hypothetical protein
MEKVSTLLGHESLDTTRIYTQPSEADLQAATEKVAWQEEYASGETRIELGNLIPGGGCFGRGCCGRRGHPG